MLYFVSDMRDVVKQMLDAISRSDYTLLSDKDMIAALANLLQRSEAEILAAYDETRKAKC